LLWRAVAVALLAVALPCQRGLETLLLARFQIERVPLDFLNDVFLQNFTLEAPERVFQRFTILNANFGQRPPPVKGQQESSCHERKLLSLSLMVEAKIVLKIERKALRKDENKAKRAVSWQSGCP